MVIINSICFPVVRGATVSAQLQYNRRGTIGSERKENQTMRQMHKELLIETRGKGLYALTGYLHEWLRTSGMREGVLTLFVRHTSASLLIQENADTDVQVDLENFLSRLVPEGDPLYQHVQEGPDDMPAHVRAALTQTSLSIPLIAGGLALGTWQGIYLWEHRKAPQRRRVVAHLLGE